jgi:hypothetical protein
MLTSLAFLTGFFVLICGPGLIAARLEARRNARSGGPA